MRPRSDPAVAIATAQPPSGSPSTTPPATASSARKASSKNTSAKPSSPSRRPKPAHGDARRVERDEEVGEALVALAVRVGAEQPEQVGAERATGRPRLLAVEHPAAVDPAGPARDAGEVAAGVRLRPALAPEVLGRRHAAAGCRPAARRCRTRRCVGASRKMPFWVTRWRRAGPVVLLLEQQPLPQRRTAAAVLLGPRHHRPPVVEEPPLPLEVLREALAGVARRGLAAVRVRHSARFRSSHARASARNASSSADHVRSIAPPRLWTRRPHGDVSVHRPVMSAASGSTRPRTRCGRAARRRWGARRSRR